MLAIPDFAAFKSVVLVNGTQKAWNDDGYLVKSWTDLTRKAPRDETGRVHVWTSPNRPNLHFIWPATPRVRIVRDAAPWPIELLLVSKSPRVFVVSNFFTDDEIERLKEHALDPNNPYSMRPSTTGTQIWQKNQATKKASDRTSDNAFDVVTPTQAALRDRGFRLVRVSPKRVDAYDGLQVVRYEPEQAYAPHCDSFPGKLHDGFEFDSSKPEGSNRFATIFMYLEEAKEGGQTLFPKAPMSAVDPITRTENASVFGDVTPYPTDKVEAVFKSPPGSWERQLVKQCYGGSLSVRPKRGSAVLFYSLKGDGSVDELALHAACPVVEGVKWGANSWTWSACRHGEQRCVVERRSAVDPTEV